MAAGMRRVIICIFESGQTMVQRVRRRSSLLYLFEAERRSLNRCAITISPLKELLRFTFSAERVAVFQRFETSQKSAVTMLSIPIAIVSS
jgi:hypothetical protein